MNLDDHCDHGVALRHGCRECMAMNLADRDDRNREIRELAILEATTRPDDAFTTTERETIADLLERAAKSLDLVLSFADFTPTDSDELRETAARLRQDVPRVGVPASAGPEGYSPPTPPAWHPLRDCTCGLWAERENLGVVEHAETCPRNRDVPSAGPMERLEAMSGGES